MDDRATFLNHLSVSRETLEKLEQYAALLVDASRSLSLVGKTTLATLWTRHFLDSAQIMPMVEKSSLIDIGTGAGFPGMVLAIMGHEKVHLCENNQKKIAFLKSVAEKTQTTVTIHNLKVEALPALSIDIVTARAVAPVSELMIMAKSFFRQGSSALFLKGKTASSELDQARRFWDFDAEITPSITAPESSILHLTRIRRKK